MNRLKISLAGFAIGISALAGTAVAAEKPLIVEGNIEAPTMRVSYADLNLARPEGLDALSARIRRAAEVLCYDNGIQPLRVVMLSRACERDTIAGADPQVQEAIANFGDAQFASIKAVRVARR